MAEQRAMFHSQESEDQDDIDIVSSVLGPQGLFAYLSDKLAIDNTLAIKLFGWKPQLLVEPPYQAIWASNDHGQHQRAFNLWYNFASNHYTGTSLTELCKCLRSAGSAKQIEVAEKIESKMESMTSGGNLPGQSKSGSSSVGSRDRPFHSNVSDPIPPPNPPHVESIGTPSTRLTGEQTKWTLDNHCLFMSHSSRNKDIVDEFVQALRGKGVNVWYDKDEIRLGNEWDRKIATDMPNMYGFICCMSKDFFDSGICYRELQVFRHVQKRNKGIPDAGVFPIVIDPQSFDGVRQDWQMQLPPQTHYKKWPDDEWAILENLETFVKRPVPPNPPPTEPIDSPPTSSTGLVPPNPPPDGPIDTPPTSSTDAPLVSFPAIEEVDRSFQRLTADVNGYVFDLSDREYSSLHFYCRQRAGTLLYGPFPSDLPQLPKVKEDLMVGLSKYWNALSFDLLEDVVSFFNIPKLLERLKAHTDLSGRFCRMTLGECRKKGIKLHKSRYLKITYQEDPNKFALGRILEFQEFLKRKCGIEQSLFDGFDTSSVILFFLISRDAASQLQFKIDDSALSSLGVCCIEFEGLWKISLQTKGTHPGSVMYSPMSSSPEGAKKRRKRSTEHGSSSSKRKEPSSDSEESGIITDTSEFLSYIDAMAPHLTLLGTVLGIEDFATVTVEGSGNPQSKCLKILKQWMNVTPNHTWKSFCKKLEKSTTFSDLRARIEKGHFVSGIKKGRKRSTPPGSSSSKWKEPSSDSEESDSSASSESSEDKPKKKGSKSTKRSRSYSEVTVRGVIRRMTREKLHSGIKKMLTEQCTNLLYDDWGLINEECRDDILGDLKVNNKTKAANRLIDYFHDNHTGEELLHFCDFLTKEAKDEGRNPQLLKLAKAIKLAVYNASPGPSEPGKGEVERAAPQDSLHTEVKIPPHEKDLFRLCWVPFGIQTLKVSDAHTYLLQPNTMDCHEEDLIRLEIPKDAINTDVCNELSIRYGILVHGPFVLEEDYELASMVVYIDFNMNHTTKPLMLHLPHWASKGEATSDVWAPHKVDETQQYKFANKGLLSLATGSIPVYGHCSLFGTVVEVESQKFYYAHPLESREDTETKLSVYFTYASTVWSEIIQSHVAKCKPPSKFQLKNKDKLNAVLREDKGSGWEADFVRNIEITQGIIRYNSDSGGDLENDVWELQSYPPLVECVVQCSGLALKSGRQRRVNLVFNKMQTGLEVTCHNVFSFACTTFSEEPIGGHAFSEPLSFGSNLTPLASPRAPVPGSSKVHVSSNPEEGSYSHVRAKDALQTFNWRELRRDVKDMLTKSRVYTLEREYKLIDSSCNAIIKSDLEKGDPNSAATTLIEYFESNHNGDGMLRFCEFLRDESEEAGGSAVLEDLADRIERAVKDLGASGST